MVLVITHLFLFSNKIFSFYLSSNYKTQLIVEFDVYNLVETCPRDTDLNILLYIIRHFIYI